MDPLVEVVRALAAVNSARAIQNPAGRALELAAWETLATIATEMARAAARGQLGT